LCSAVLEGTAPIQRQQSISITEEAAERERGREIREFCLTGQYYRANLIGIHLESKVNVRRNMSCCRYSSKMMPQGAGNLLI